MLARIRIVIIACSILNLLFAFIVFNGFGINRLNFLEGVLQSWMSTNGEATGPIDGLKLMIVKFLLILHLYTLYRYRTVYSNLLKILLIIDFVVTMIMMYALFIGYLFSDMFDGGFEL